MEHTARPLLAKPHTWAGSQEGVRLVQRPPLLAIQVVLPDKGQHGARQIEEASGLGLWRGGAARGGRAIPHCMLLAWPLHAWLTTL